MALGGVILIGLLVAYAFAWVVAQAARSEAEVAEYGDVPWIHPEMLGVKAAGKFAGGGAAKEASGLRVTGSQTSIQFNSHSNSRIKSGQAGQ